MAENLYMTYRPSRLSEIYGHHTYIEGLKKSFKEKTISQNLLIAGPTGTGKTTIARIIAKHLMCSHLDELGNSCEQCANCKDINSGEFRRSVKEMNASNLKIDAMRDLEENIFNKDFYNDRKVFILDEFQEIPSKESEKNILKLLETKFNGEVYFIIGTMDYNKLDKAIPGRCKVYQLDYLKNDDIAEYLQYICKQKNIELDLEKAETLFTIADNSDGSQRNACSLLETVIESNLWGKESLVREKGFISEIDLNRNLISLVKGESKFNINLISKKNIDK